MSFQGTTWFDISRVRTLYLGLHASLDQKHKVLLDNANIKRYIFDIYGLTALSKTRTDSD